MYMVVANRVRAYSSFHQQKRVAISRPLTIFSVMDIQRWFEKVAEAVAAEVLMARRIARKEVLLSIHWQVRQSNGARS